MKLVKKMRKDKKKNKKKKSSEGKEADTIKLPALPEAREFRNWRTAVRQSVVAASGRPVRCLQWLMQLEAANDMSTLASSGKFTTLDVKLASAITLLANDKSPHVKELARRIALESDNEAAGGRLIRGRQLLWMVYRYNATDEDLGALYDFNDLNSVTFTKDKEITQFITNWDMVLAALNEPVADRIKEQTFLRELRKSSAMREDIAHYDRCDKGNEHKTYQYLYDQVKKHILRKRLEDNRKTKAAAFNPEGHQPAFAGANGKSGKGKGGKGKGC